MSAVAQPRAGSLLAIGSFVVVIGVCVAVVILVQQALVAQSPSGYQVTILHLARQIGLAPPQPTFGDPTTVLESYGRTARRGGREGPRRYPDPTPAQPSAAAILSVVS
jgi:hypothetical protein